MPSKKDPGRIQKCLADVDKLLSKERVLYSSRYFYSKRLWVVVDEHLDYKKDTRTNRTVHTVVKGLNDVYFQISGRWVHTPSDVDRSLVYFNHCFEDGVGVVDDSILRCILDSLQHAEERATEIKQRSFGLGQAVSLTDKGSSKAEEDHRALRHYEMF